MDEERDLITLTDEDGNELLMDILDYFYYEGKQYALMVEASEDDEDAPDEDQEAYIMSVNPVGEDEEEFVSVEDEDLLAALINFVENELYADEDEEFGDAEDPDEE